MCYMFALKNSLKHEFLVGFKVNSNSNVSKFEKYIKYRLFFNGLIGIWCNFEGFSLPFFKLENKNLKTL